MEIAIVTGPSSGIGRATAVALARAGFHVIGAGRSETRAGPTISQIIGEGGSAEYLNLDLASLDSAREAARSFEASGRKLSIVVNNAGVGPVKGMTTDGFEIHFGVNHLGHFMFTHHLRRTLLPGARIVQVSSEMHRRVDGIDLESVRRRSRSFFGLKEYATSKLANILFVTEMARQQPDWRIYAVHPGLVETGIIPPYVRPLTRGMLTPDEGADTVVWCATDPGLSDESGLYYTRRALLRPSPAAENPDLAKALWNRSERWCGVAPVHG